MKHKRSAALLASAAMTASTFSSAFALPAMAEGTTVTYKDGIYTGNAVVTDDGEDNDFTYDISVSVTVSGNRITDLTVTKGEDRSGRADPDENDTYLNYAINGRTKSKKYYPGVGEQLKGQETINVDDVQAISGATYSTDGIKEAVKAALKDAAEETPVTVDKSSLQAKVSEVTDAGYVQTDYTTESWNTLQDALTAANDVLTDESATQERVNNALTALTNAVNGLTKAAPTVDKTALQKAIADAETVTEQGNYTDESYTAFTKALDAAKAVYNDTAATAEQVTNAATALTEAKQNLTEKTVEPEPEVTSGYVLMNIPYDKFYEAETANNSIPVDAFTSATRNKTRTGSLAGGSYHVDPEGSDITGITYAVYVKDFAKLADLTRITDDSSVEITVTNRGQTSTTTYSGKDALFESASYSYYVLGSEYTGSYKILTVNEDGSFSFGKATGEAKILTGITAELTTDTAYGDYELDLDEKLKTEIGENATVYAVVVNTADGTGYGMRHLENIWRTTELAWCTGFTKAVHNCPTSSEHYESMMGKTISSVTYYTSTGIYDVDIADVYVPVISGAEVKAADSTSGNGSTTVTFTSLPEGFAPDFSENDPAVTAEKNDDGSYTLHYTGANPGKYTLTVKDGSGRYAPLKAEFTLSTTSAAAAFNEDGDEPALKAAQNVSADQFSAYVKGITKVTVNNTEYSTSGRGSVKIVNADGSINLSAASNGSNVFTVGQTYTVEVSSAGYPDLKFSFTYTSSVYVLMNIPYDAFYEAEISNSTDVDEVTSATKSKFQSSGLVGGSYHTTNTDGEGNVTGGTINGVTYAVKVKDTSLLAAAKQVASEEELFSAANYSYVVLTEKPSAYKILTADAEGNYRFGPVMNDAETLTGVTVKSFSTSSRYGDYELVLNGLPEDLGDVSAVVLKTKEGDSYGLRHLENIWRKYDLAWSVGITTKEVHGNTLSAEHYKNMVGQTITEIVYYTENGQYIIDLGKGVYVPVKSETSLSVDDGNAGSGSVEVSVEKLPDDFKAVYKINGETVTVQDGKLQYTDMAPGKYTLTLSDGSGKYADVTASFVLSTETSYAAFNGSDTAPALQAAENITTEQFSAYVQGITKVTVNNTGYSTSGKRGVKIVNADGTINLSAVSNKANIFEEDNDYTVVVSADGYPDLEFTFTYKIEYTYLYAALTWDQYWAAEGVQNGSSTESVDNLDSHGEYDLGAFDAVTRATTNHGLHRGSYQCTTVIETTGGQKLYISSWSEDGKNINLGTGSTVEDKSVGFSRGTITYSDGTTDKLQDYKVLGIKYVPVKVKTADLEAFKAAYTTVDNGEALVGGYGENKLSAYSYTADVTADTNNLKTATRNADGSFSFSAAQTGTDSGLKDVALKTAANLEPAVKAANGSYGEFLRVDINGDYGDLGASMQSVEWTYYGDDATRSNALVTFGTKFAADNWMHKSMGIQLGLTESLRCQLPEGTNGTGYWTLTVHALGYNDYTWDFKATEDNIADQSAVSDATKSALEELVKQAEALSKDNFTEDTWKNLETELGESKDLLSKTTTLYEGEAAEQINHLQDAMNNLAVYALMNVPYDEFFDADINNDTGVDVVTSATKNKTKNSNLVRGSYHTEDGSQITGVTVPVKVKYSSLVAEDKAENADALFAGESYDYTILGETPAVYKELTVTKAEDGTLVYSFGKTQGNVTKLETATAEITADTNWGDYEIDVTGVTEGEGRNAKSVIGDTIYGVVLTATDGTSYGLRHLENVWRTSELAWSTGFTTTSHGSPLNADHYKSIMGKTISGITYYTNTGVYTISTKLYVPIKTADATVSVENGSSGSGTVKVNATLPQNFEAEYEVSGLTGAVTAGQLVYANAMPGSYTLTVKDKSGKYADISASFVLSTSETAVKFNGSKNEPAIKAADGVSEADFSNYLSKVTKVTVNGVEYSATGRGAVKILNADGTINLEATDKSGNKIFGEKGKYEIVVTATGYPDLSFSFNTKSSSSGGSSSSSSSGSSSDSSSSDSTTTTSSTAAGTTTSTSAVKTGDSSNLLGWMGVLAAAVASGAGAVFLRRRQK